MHMNTVHMKRVVAVAAFASLATLFAVADTAVTNAYRVFLSSSSAYDAGSRSSSDILERLGPSLMFAFDCTRTNGWTIASDGRVTKIPSLVQSGPHAERYLTTDSSEVVDPYYFSAYRIFYGEASTITPGTFVASDPDGVLKGPYIDFGAVGSKKGLFFNQVEHEPWSRTVSGTLHSGTTANIMTNIGSVVGVYKPTMGAACVTNNKGVVYSKEGGGLILGGNHFQRFASFSVDEDGLYRDGVGLKRALVKYNVTGALKGGFAWSGLQKTSADVQTWTGGWQVMAANPTAATLMAYGVGIGNVSSTDESVSSGGQSIAELMIFDRVLTDEETKDLIVYLERKWMSAGHKGWDGVSSMSWLGVSDATEYPPVSPSSASFNVPEGKTMRIGRLTGGRHSGDALPQVVKNGAGSIKVEDADGFGGELVVQGGSVAFAPKKAVPAFEDLPDQMMLRVDASDMSTIDVVDGLVAEWRSVAPAALKAFMHTDLVQSDAGRRPSFVADALGPGLNVVDFGTMSATSGSYMSLSVRRHYTTVIAVVDARIQGGGHIMNTMFRRNVDSFASNVYWNNATYRRLLYGGVVYVGDWSGSLSPSTYGSAWVDGREIDPMADGYEAPSWQVVAYRVPTPGSAVSYVGANGSADAVSAAGGLRLGELMAWRKPLTDDEIRDVQAYLMKKWLGRVPGGYDDGRGVPELQNLRLGGAGTAVDVAEGAVAKVGRLVTDGPAVKTGDGTLVVCEGSDLSGGLEIRGGKVVAGRGSDVTDKCEVAANPSLRLDPSDINSIAFVKSGMSNTNPDGTLVHGGTNYVWNWQDMSGRIAALQSDEQTYKHVKPFLNTNSADLCNGLPTVDFGYVVPGWSNDTTPGRYLRLSRTLVNVRSVYMVLGSQEGGGQPLGCRTGECIDGYTTSFKDFLRDGNLSPSAGDPLFKNSCPNIKDGDLWINGVQQDDVASWVPSGGYDLVELHTPRGCAINALATGFAMYVHGGCRIGELIVFERPLSDREKTATRNYLLHKWFGREESSLADLPEKSALSPLSGDMSIGEGCTLSLEYADGAIVDPMAITGTFSFGSGATISVAGFGDEVKTGDRLLLAKAGSCDGYAGVTFDFGREFSPGVRPYPLFSKGRLMVRFGLPGTTFFVR